MNLHTKPKAWYSRLIQTYFKYTDKNILAIPVFTSLCEGNVYLLYKKEATYIIISISIIIIVISIISIIIVVIIIIIVIISINIIIIIIIIFIIITLLS